MQIGSKLYPEYPIKSHAEAYYQLRITIGHISPSAHNFAIKPHAYRSNKFVVEIDPENVLEARFTGLNTRASDLLTVTCKYAKPEAAAQ